MRSKHGYGLAAERAMHDKCADYFACGTLVVWDVDLQSEDVVKSYQVSNPDSPLFFRRGQMADAEPAVPGWWMVAIDKTSPDFSGAFWYYLFIQHLWEPKVPGANPCAPLRCASPKVFAPLAQLDRASDF
jgi:hypothetical protein